MIRNEQAEQEVVARSLSCCQRERAKSRRVKRAIVGGPSRGTRTTTASQIPTANFGDRGSIVARISAP
ncbi:hypothetical protein PILCRDRAFT_814053 [Piloderma croceum F 1598]|uniref:Uncharacterized protein n=1 Tax=Piloderma croceum (strain F 1598) TaxID=765440 RepID=A0A0C3GBX1_PILCF|nr:hypothetical protein PILCRDRAFT_814053 [Piloderma croceum F 1598]